MGILDISSSLDDFAIITYLVDYEVLQAEMADFLQPYAVLVDGVRFGLVSAVPFRDRDFRFQALPCCRFAFGQINYRAYATHRHTGEQVVWFWGTELDSILCVVPRQCWRLPWHRSAISIRTVYDEVRARYDSYQVESHGGWGDCRVSVVDSGQPVTSVIGFADCQQALEALTNPTTGYYYRRDGRVGSYSIAHPPIPVSHATISFGSVGLFDRLGLQPAPHSAFLCRSIDFDIFLPPRVVAPQVS